jgi:hypothetical protein
MSAFPIPRAYAECKNCAHYITVRRLCQSFAFFTAVSTAAFCGSAARAARQFRGTGISVICGVVGNTHFSDRAARLKKAKGRAPPCLLPLK